MKIKGLEKTMKTGAIIFQDRLVMTASITLRVDYLIVLFLCFFSPLEFSIEIISGKYFTV